MRKLNLCCKLLAIVILAGCANSTSDSDSSLFPLLEGLPRLEGKVAFLDAPYVTAGNRVYAVGHQDGTFPNLGWHVTGEMGGIWDHPIKLMDGFSASISNPSSGEPICLSKASSFSTVPMANILSYDVETLGLEVRRLQFVPDDQEGMIVEFRFVNNSEVVLEGFSFDFTGMVDLRQVWLGERTNMVDYQDSVIYDSALDAFVGKDAGNEWYTVFGSAASSSTDHEIGSACQAERIGKGIDGTLSYPLSLKPGESTNIVMVISGSATSKQEAVDSYNALKSQYSSMFRNKINHYQEVNERNKLTIADQDIQTMYEWTKYCTEWLVREVPEHGTGISAGLPDYPWWFGADLAYTIQGLMPTGNHELAKKAIEQIFAFSESENGNGRIVHEVSTNGVVFNPGNVNETPIMIATSWEMYTWTGDRALLEVSYEMAKKGLKWLEEVDEDGNGYPDGHGMMEIRGMDSEMVDVVAYTQQAYDAAANMAEELGERDEAVEYRNKADLLREKINSEWWVASANSFADFRAEKSKAMELLEDAIIRADTLEKPWAVEELNTLKSQMASYPNEKQGHAFYHNWVVNTPMELGIASPELAAKALETGRKFTNKFGVYVTGLDRDELFDESFAASKSKEDFNYVGAVMTLPTGVQSVAESRYGETEQALAYLKMLHNSFSYATPGTMYEVSPDYGMLVQAWNINGVAKPIVSYFFGIRPEAHRKRVLMQPDLPESWPGAKLENVLVGNNNISVDINVGEGRYAMQIDQTEPDWKVVVQLPVQEGKSVLVNGKKVDPDEIENRWQLELSGSSNTIEIN